MVNGESLSQKIERFNEAVDKKIGNVSKVKKAMMFVDFMDEYLLHGAYLQDYIQYKFYDKKRSDRRKYVVFGKLIEMMKKCNNPANRHIFDHKPDFDKTFSKYLYRDWLDVSQASFDEFVEFMDKHKEYFVKDPDGMFGEGVNRITVTDELDMKATYEDYAKKGYLLEEPLTQCKEMAAFNESSINTLRVVSLIDKDGVVHIMGGLLRVGRPGKIADNFHHQGIASYIDPENGTVITRGIDKDDVWHAYHPDSGEQIIGFRVPVWDKVCDTIKEAAKVVPDMRYIGWDVAITENYDIALIEGNPGADPDAEQITTMQGRWPLYERYI